jgi:Homeodomain-like domain-containing protein
MLSDAELQRLRNINTGRGPTPQPDDPLWERLEARDSPNADMVRVTRDAKIIDLRRDGLTYVQIAPLVGVSKSTVADAIKRWMDAKGPSAEQVEELRQFQGAQLDAYQAQLAPHLMRPLRNDEGEIIYDGNGDDRKPIQVLDLQTGELGKPQITAEMMAELFGYDTAEDPMDIEADEEMPDKREALGLGSGD